MTSPPLDNTQGRQRQAWQAITALDRHIQLDDVGRGMKSAALGQHKLSDDVGRGMLSSLLGITHDRTTSGVACYHRLKAAHTIERRRAWHDITSLGQHTWSDDVGRGMPSSSLGSTNGRTTPTWHANITFGQHTRSNNVECGMPASPLGSTQSKDVERGMTSPP